jgi:N-acylglucosamine 2-epimerase
MRLLAATYRDGLLEDVLPFWVGHCIDREHGGFLHYLDRDGSVLSTDKGIWVQGRFTWLLSRLYNTVERRDEWLELARHGVEFLIKHAFDEDGRCFYSVTRSGRPLRKRRYLFSEAFVTIALAEYARAAADEQLKERAFDLFDLILRYHRTPGLLEPKVFPETRRARSHAMPMILLVTAQVLAQIDDRALLADVIQDSLNAVFNDFLRPEKKVLLETVGADGECLDGPEGRLVLPGHAIETAWFIMQEAGKRGDDALLEQACRILDWSLNLGWDKEHGGLLYFVDVEGKPAEPYEHDMKLWWPHTEAEYAMLLAHLMTGEAKYLDWHARIHEWAYSHFPDAEFGEWFGYLHRDGTISSRVKGNMWKGPFHLPRMQLYGWQLLQQHLSATRDD